MSTNRISALINLSNQANMKASLSAESLQVNLVIILESGEGLSDQEDGILHDFKKDRLTGTLEDNTFTLYNKDKAEEPETDLESEPETKQGRIPVTIFINKTGEIEISGINELIVNDGRSIRIFEDRKITRENEKAQGS